jgi:hypothetical protein
VPIGWEAWWATADLYAIEKKTFVSVRYRSVAAKLSAFEEGVSAVKIPTDKP